jgi:two-component system OmpR family sensor kinase
VVIRITDDGCGIAPEQLPNIFNRFYRADQSRTRETGNAGLGLAISKGIVEAHGGQIEVESTPGTGTSFKITLPLLGLESEAETEIIADISSKR